VLTKRRSSRADFENPRHAPQRIVDTIPSDGWKLSAPIGDAGDVRPQRLELTRNGGWNAAAQRRLGYHSSGEASNQTAQPWKRVPAIEMSS
jgi:hypothetical protein